MNGPPSTLGQYQIIREIARSNDIVYEAYDPLMNRRVAIKELAVPGGSTPQQREERISRFKREAQAAGTLNHPNIMTVFSFAEDAGRIFMALEYLDGATLRNEIDTKGFVPETEAIEIAREILNGLGHAHSKGVIHRDIKPDNIQILSNGNIKITDFGIARLTFQPNLTMDGQVFGTPSYMSPEQVVGKEIDARSDLFSVGVLLYEMVSGQKPFAGDSVVSITYAIMNNEPTKPQQCSSALWDVIRKALDKSPMMRFGSADEMSKALETVLLYDSNASNTYSTPVSTSPYQANYPANPTVAPPAYTFNPYSNTVTPGQAPPQLVQANTTPYVANPYATTPYPPSQGQYNQNPYMTGGSMPPPAGFNPIYYPPPPRQPLLKPQTADFLKRLAIAIVVIGTLFALVFVALGAAVNAIQTSAAERQDESVVVKLDEYSDKRVPVDERLQKLQAMRAQVHTVKNIEAVDNRIAELMAEQGQQAQSRGRIADAEKFYQDAIATDSNNPVLYTYLASLYEAKAQQATDPGSSLQLWQLSGEYWKNAYLRQPDGQRKSQYGDGAAAAYYNFAYEALQTNATTRQTARQYLYDAKEMATPDSQVYVRVSELIDQLR
jgi:serine/threonine-protein kinase